MLRIVTYHKDIEWPKGKVSIVDTERDGQPVPIEDIAVELVGSIMRDWDHGNTLDVYFGSRHLGRFER